MILHSKFTVWVYFLFVVSLFLLLLSGALVSLFFESPTASTIVVVVFSLLFMLGCLAWLVWGELRTKAIQFSIEPGRVTSKGFAGMGAKKTVLLSELTGFKTALLPSSVRDYEYMYLMMADKKVVKLSEFYHKNYDALKKEIAGQLNDLGMEPFSLSRELIEIFK